MADIATLSIKIDTADIKRAKGELTALEASVKAISKARINPGTALGIRDIVDAMSQLDKVNYVRVRTTMASVSNLSKVLNSLPTRALPSRAIASLATSLQELSRVDGAKLTRVTTAIAALGPAMDTLKGAAGLRPATLGNLAKSLVAISAINGGQVAESAKGVRALGAALRSMPAKAGTSPAAISNLAKSLEAISKINGGKVAESSKGMRALGAALQAMPAKAGTSPAAISNLAKSLAAISRINGGKVTEAAAGMRALSAALQAMPTKVGTSPTAISNLSKALRQISNLSGQKLVDISNSMRQLGQGLSAFSGVRFRPKSISNFAVALTELSRVDAAKLRAVAKALSQIERTGTGRSIEALTKSALQAARSIEQLQVRTKRLESRLNPARVTAFGRALSFVGSAAGGAVGAIRRTVSSITTLGAKMRTFRANILNVGAGFLVFSFLQRSVVQLIKPIREFETALVNISKTTNLTGRDLQDLSDELLSIASNSVATTDQLLQVAGIAGQLGVKGRSDILKFADTVTRLADAAPSLRGSFEQTALQLARVLNITGEGIGKVDRLASTVLKLGNNFEALESTILKTTIEVAAASAAFGVTSADAAALATALARVSVPPERGRTAIITTMKAISDALRSTGEDAQNFNQIIGTGSVKALQELFKNDPTEAFLKLVEGLRAVRDGGGDVTATLNRLGLNSIRTQTSILALLGSTEKFRRALSLAREEFATTGDELERVTRLASDRLDAAFVRLTNTFRGLLIEFSKTSGLETALRDSLELISDIARSISPNTVDQVGQFAGNVKRLRDQLLGVKKDDALNSAFSNLENYRELIGKIGDFVRSVSGGVITTAASFASLFLASRALSIGLSTVLSPLGLISLGITGAVGLLDKFGDKALRVGDQFVRLRDVVKAIGQESARRLESFIQVVGEIASKQSALTSAVLEDILSIDESKPGDVFDRILDAADMAVEYIGDQWVTTLAKVETSLLKIGNSMRSITTAVLETTAAYLDLLKPVIAWAQLVGEEIATAVTDLLDGQGSAVRTINSAARMSGTVSEGYAEQLRGEISSLIAEQERLKSALDAFKERGEIDESLGREVIGRERFDELGGMKRITYQYELHDKWQEAIYEKRKKMAELTAIELRLTTNRLNAESAAADKRIEDLKKAASGEAFDQYNSRFEKTGEAVRKAINSVLTSLGATESSTDKLLDGFIDGVRELAIAAFESSKPVNDAAQGVTNYVEAVNGSAKAVTDYVQLVQDASDAAEDFGGTSLGLAPEEAEKVDDILRRLTRQYEDLRRETVGVFDPARAEIEQLSATTSREVEDISRELNQIGATPEQLANFDSLKEKLKEAREVLLQTRRDRAAEDLIRTLSRGAEDAKRSMEAASSYVPSLGQMADEQARYAREVEDTVRQMRELGMSQEDIKISKAFAFDIGPFKGIKEAIAGIRVATARAVEDAIRLGASLQEIEQIELKGKLQEDLAVIEAAQSAASGFGSAITGAIRSGIEEGKKFREVIGDVMLAASEKIVTEIAIRPIENILDNALAGLFEGMIANQVTITATNVTLAGAGLAAGAPGAVGAAGAVGAPGAGVYGPPLPGVYGPPLPPATPSVDAVIGETLPGAAAGAIDTSGIEAMNAAAANGATQVADMATAATAASVATSGQEAAALLGTVAQQAESTEETKAAFIEQAEAQASQQAAAAAVTLAAAMKAAAASAVISAKGNIFGASGVVKAFAKGGVPGGGLRGRFGDMLTNGPVAFPLGLAGEAGPEAIVPVSRRGGSFTMGTADGRQIPLTRDTSGNLVADLAGMSSRNTRKFASGAILANGRQMEPHGGSTSGYNGGTVVNQTINIQTKDADSFRRSERQVQSQLRKSVSRANNVGQG